MGIGTGTEVAARPLVKRVAVCACSADAHFPPKGRWLWMPRPIRAAAPRPVGQPLILSPRPEGQPLVLSPRPGGPPHTLSRRAPEGSRIHSLAAPRRAAAHVAFAPVAVRPLPCCASPYRGARVGPMPATVEGQAARPAHRHRRRPEACDRRPCRTCTEETDGSPRATPPCASRGLSSTWESPAALADHRAVVVHVAPAGHAPLCHTTASQPARQASASR